MGKIERDKLGRFKIGNKSRLGSKHRKESLIKLSESLKGRDVWNRVDLNEKKLKELYLVKKLSIKEISNSFSVGNNCVHQNLIRYKIPRREQGFQKGHVVSEETMKKILKRMSERPTKMEQKVIKLIKNYNLPFKYCGDGSKVKGGKNPDFISFDEKIVIDVADKGEKEYHKKKSWMEYELERIEHFEKYNQKCVVIWKEDINDIKFFKKLKINIQKRKEILRKMVHKLRKAWNTFEIDIDEFKKLYYLEKKTQKEIADKFGVGRDTVIEFMKRHNLEARKTQFESQKDAWNKGLSKKIDPRVDYERPTRFTKGNQMWKLRK